MPVLLYAPADIAIKSLTRVFEHSSIPYELCHNKERCLELAARHTYSVILVIHVASLSELLDFHAEWKKTGSKAAFVVISKRQSGAERVQALQSGIKSYHITPFSYTQLIMDIAQYEYMTVLPEQSTSVQGLTINFLSRSVTYEGSYVSLTKKQFDLLSLFMRHPGQIFNRVQIWEQVWSNGEYPLANTVDVHVNRLRKSLPPGARGLIETVYGFGYRLRPR